MSGAIAVHDEEVDPTEFRLTSHELTSTIGLVVPHDELLGRTLERAHRILRRGADAYAAAKRILNLAPAIDLASGTAIETLDQSLLVTTDEHRRRLDAARRRQPDA